MESPLGDNISSLYFAEDWVDSWYDHTHQIIVMTWFNLTTTIHYRPSYMAQLDAAKKYKTRALIVDTSKAFGMAHPQDHMWLITSVFPEAKKLNLEFIINIFPENSIARTGVKTILDCSRECDFRILKMSNLEEAFNFIKIALITGLNKKTRCK